MIDVDIQYEDQQVRQALRRLIDALHNPRPVMAEIGEYLIQSHRKRFDDAVSPDGVPWAANSRRTPKFAVNLPLHGETLNLRDSMTYQQPSDDVLLFGPGQVTKPYAAIHQFGGAIKHAARSQRAYFKYDDRSGTVSNLFVKKSKSNFAQWVTIGEHEVNIPARPYLGISNDDRHEILGKLHREYMQAVGVKADT